MSVEAAIVGLAVLSALNFAFSAWICISIARELRRWRRL